jgi:hypothetical protein
VSFSDVSIMLLISGIWLIGCQFTWLAFGMLGFSSSAMTGSGAALARRRQSFPGPGHGRTHRANCQGRHKHARPEP